MALIHTDTPVSDLKINKFASVADFEAAQAQSLIGADEISFIDEAMQVDWNQSDSTKPDYIKNKPTIPSGLNDLSDVNMASPSNGQVLTYDNTNSVWKNQNLPDELPSQSGQSGKYLTTDGTDASWADIPEELPVISLGDSGKVLKVNATEDGVEWGQGGGGGDTVTGKTVTLGSTGKAVIQVNGSDSGSVSLPLGSTSQVGIVQLTDSTSSTSTSTAATPNSVKSAYDLANSAIQKSTGTTGGDIIYFTGASIPTRLAKGSAGQVLTMNSGATAPEWQTPSPGASSLAALTDTSINSPSNGQVLTYDNGTSKWINSPVPTELPSITGNASKILAVNSGTTGVEWTALPGSLPTPTSSDENKLLSVNSSGNYVLVTIVNSENVAY